MMDEYAEVQIKIVIAFTLLAVASADLATNKIQGLKASVDQTVVTQKTEEEAVVAVDAAVAVVAAVSEDFDCNDRQPMASCLLSTRDECNAAKVNGYACVWDETATADLPFITNTKACSEGSMFYDGVSAGTVYQEWDLACCKESTEFCR